MFVENVETSQVLSQNSLVETKKVLKNWWSKYIFYKREITEKLWKVLRINIVPVVLGGANYKQLLPPKSYIDIRDFSSVKALADYLHMVSENDELYREYFAWKRHYIVLSISPDDLVCQVCAFLNRYHNVTNVIPRLDQVYGKRENCLEPKEYFPQQMLNELAL